MMNWTDSIRHPNSWHWLAAVAALAAVGSCFVPKYGWRDALAYRKTTLAPRVTAAQATVDALKALDAAEAQAADRQSAALRARTAQLRQDFAAYGLDPLPAGDDAVFAAQSRISEALAKRRIRIVSNEAGKAKAVGTEAQGQARGAGAARTRASGKTAGGTGPRAPAAPAPSAPPAPPRVPLPFRTSEIGYRAVGDFRDVFMFFVAETHLKPNYAFRDIAVKRGADGMDVSFTLRVQHR
ncbi:MAG: hypothetical protein ACI4RD_01195 [Kiritimatiellia bacterium]